MPNCVRCNQPIDCATLDWWEFNGKSWCCKCLEKERKVTREASDADAVECIKGIIEDRKRTIRGSSGGHMIPDSVAIETAKFQVAYLLGDLLCKAFVRDRVREDA